MSVLEKFIEGMTNQDLPLLESLLHEDMFFVQDTTMETKEEWIKDTKEQFANGNFDATKMEISEKFETKDMGALEVTLIEDSLFANAIFWPLAMACFSISSMRSSIFFTDASLFSNRLNTVNIRSSIRAMV